MSVAKLCENISTSPACTGTEKIEGEVYTTLANGDKELSFKEREQQLIEGVPVRFFKRLTKDHSHFSPSLYCYLWKTVKDFDLVHIHAWWNLVTVISCIIAKMKGVKVLISPRGTLSSYSFDNRSGILKRMFHKLVGSHLLKDCFFHVTTEKEKRDIINLLSPLGIWTISNFVRLPPTTEQAPITPRSFDTNKILFLSRIEEKKGLELLLEALPGLNEKWQLSIAGSGREKYVKSLKVLSERLEISAKINWMGHVDNVLKFEVMRQHDLLILPSFDENFANVVIECLSTGTPVIITENVGLSDYVKSRDLGWVCSRTRKSLADTLKQAINNLEKRQRIHQCAESIVRKDFSDKHLTAKYCGMYNEIVYHL
jgi:glycosyltransferase involved in cell wall biosynthesis